MVSDIKNSAPKGLYNSGHIIESRTEVGFVPEGLSTRIPIPGDGGKNIR